MVKIFEQVECKKYADEVRRIAKLSDSETDESSGSGDEYSQLEQPPTYPIYNQQQSLLQHPSAAPESSETYYVIVNEENPPESKILSYDLINNRSLHRVFYLTVF